MSTIEIHYGGQRYELDPEEAPDFLVRIQMGMLRMTDGASVITARLKNGEFLWLVASPSIPLAIMQTGDIDPPKPNRG